jgi:cell division protein FtsW
MGAPLRHLRAVPAGAAARTTACPATLPWTPLRDLWLATLRRVPFTVTLAAVGLLCGLQAFSLWRAPAAWMPAAITIRLAPGDSVTLGRRELAAPQADKAHLSLQRAGGAAADGADGWTLRNLSASRQVVVLRDGGEQRLGSTPLAAQQRFQIGSAMFEVLAADARSVTFTRDGHQWRYDGAVLYRDGAQQHACPDAHVASRAMAAWNRWMPAPLMVARPMAFGGNLHCDNRLGLGNVTPGSALMARSSGKLQLAAGSPDGERAAVLLHSTPNAATGGSADTARRTDLRKQEASLAGVNAIIVGHTRFQLDAQAGRLTLTPSRHVALFSAPELKLPEQIDWSWQQRTLWQGAGSLATQAWIAVAVCLAATLAMAVLRHSGAALLASGCVLLCGVAALVAQRLGMAPPAACSLALAAVALLLWLAMPGRLTLLAAAGAVLLATGLLAQLELGLGAPESSWLRYYQKSAAMLAIGAGLAGLLRVWFRHHAARGVHLSQRSIEWLLALLAAVALAALAAQVLWGDETGVFDLQPVELAKLALTALTAHCLALRFGWHSGPQPLTVHGARWMQLIAPALLFLALLGLALVQVDDFSPLILLLVWSCAMAMAYALAARNRVLAASLACLVMTAVGAVVWLRYTGSDDLIRWGFYADRFLVWLNPAEHPHTGQQLLLGARAIAEGGWLGADHALGLRTLGLSAGSAVQIPAVQDDFAAAFFLNRHGLAGGLLLWMAQAALLAGLVQVAVRCHAAGAAARDFRHAWSGRFRYFALCGGAAFVLGHLLLSWGTNLAIFPIMGQPMSFLSAGGSHLLFFLCPLLAFGAVSAQSFEENESCQSMFNTKS